MKSSFPLLLASLLLVSCSDNRPLAEASFDVIPCPQTVEPTADGGQYIIDKNTVIHYSPETPDMERNAHFLQEYALDILGYEIPVKAGLGDEGINLQLLSGDEASEAYELTTSATAVKLTATAPAGIFYGIQTLRKALPLQQNVRVSLPAVHITDAPRFGYRGTHLDCCRHFWPLDSVKTYIDMLALHNINRFHWHLTDDQGWRIEIKKYPGLTEIGSRRSGTMIEKQWGSNDSIPVEGFYTQEEAREIVRYAAERYIEVIPEIEMPGHMQGALAAYPQLGCTGGPYDVLTQWGISDDVLCMGNPDVVPFCKDILDEVLDIFPSRLIHIGGDECPKVRWEKCPKCQAKIKELGLTKDTEKHYSGWEGYVQYTPEQKLQSWFTRQIDEYLTQKGRQAIGWDEILEGGVSENAVVMSWRGIDGGIEAARLGHDVVMVPTSYFYLDYCQRKDTSHEPLSIGGYVPIEKVYSFNPLPEALTPDEQQHIIGVQANVWTEYIASFNHVQYMLLPRAAALAEVQWSQPEHRDYAAFRQRLDHMVELYQLYGWRVSMQYVEEPAVLDEP